MPPRASLGLLALVACAGPSPHARPATELAVAPSPPAAFGDPARVAKLAAAFPELDRLLDAQRAAQQIPGFAFGLVVDGALVYQHSTGVLDLETKVPVDADTVFRIGSITKTFTSLAILQLRDGGVLGLDDSLARWLPELAAIKYPTRDSTPFTIRQALMHTTGLPPVGNYSTTRSDRGPTEADMLSGLGSIVLATPPGARYAYSNFAMGLLGLVIERASGEPYRQWVSREILAPLEMRASYWDDSAVPPARLASPYAGSPPKRVALRWKLGAAESAGGMYTTLHDMARYAAFQLSADPPRDEPEPAPLRRSSLRESHATQHAVDLVVTAENNARAEGIGLAWWGYRSCDFEQVVWHPGGTEGYRATIHLLPQRGAALILMTNYVDTDYTKIIEPALALVRPYLPPRTLPVAAGLTRAMAGLVELYAQFSEAKYHALFSQQMRDAVPAAAIVELQASLTKVHGACTTVSPIAVDSPVSARFAVGCERGHLEYTVTLGEDGQIVAAGVTSHEGATAAPASSCVARTTM